MTQLGTMADLPREYVEGLAAQSVIPLWPALRNVLPHGRPAHDTRPFMWKFSSIRPELLKAGTLAPIEKAERRVLVLANPGLDITRMMATPTIYAGLQLILPGEHAPAHRHTPSAVRFVIEGQGAYTDVEGERCHMEPGDLILTPSGTWHEHGHQGSGPVIWLDALDLPLLVKIENSYAEERHGAALPLKPDRSQSTYRRAGLLPFESLSRPRLTYPLMRFPWRDVRAALDAYATVVARDQPAQLAYVNVETGAECLPTMGFSALRLDAGQELTLRRRSSSAVVHVVEGRGESDIDGMSFQWQVGDTLALPTHATVRHRAQAAPAYLFVIDDAPLQRKLGIYEEFTV